MLGWISKLYKKMKRHQSSTTRRPPPLRLELDPVEEGEEEGPEERTSVERARASTEVAHGSPPRPSTRYIPTHKSPGNPIPREVARIIRSNSSESFEARMRNALMARHLEDMAMQHRLREYRKLQTLRRQPPL